MIEMRWVTRSCQDSFCEQERILQYRQMIDTNIYAFSGMEHRPTIDKKMEWSKWLDVPTIED